MTRRRTALAPAALVGTLLLGCSDTAQTPSSRRHPPPRSPRPRPRRPHRSTPRRSSRPPWAARRPRGHRHGARRALGHGGAARRDRARHAAGRGPGRAGRPGVSTVWVRTVRTGASRTSSPAVRAACWESHCRRTSRPTSTCSSTRPLATTTASCGTRWRRTARRGHARPDGHPEELDPQRWPDRLRPGRQALRRHRRRAEPSRGPGPVLLGGRFPAAEPDGSIPPDNPTAGSPLWSLGHRNPQGLGWDSTGRLIAAEFGQDEWDETQRHPARRELRLARGRGARRRWREVHRPRADVGHRRRLAVGDHGDPRRRVRRGPARGNACGACR